MIIVLKSRLTLNYTTEILVLYELCSTVSMESVWENKLIWRRCKQKHAAERTYERHVTELQMSIAPIRTSITPLIAFLPARETKYGTQAAYKKSRGGRRALFIFPPLR
jgi:hypothetical protein